MHCEEDVLPLLLILLSRLLLFHFYHLQFWTLIIFESHVFDTFHQDVYLDILISVYPGTPHCLYRYVTGLNPHLQGHTGTFYLF